MDYNDLSKTSLIEIMEEMTKLDKNIELSLLKYERLRLEIIKRFPYLEKEEGFKKKVLK